MRHNRSQDDVENKMLNDLMTIHPDYFASGESSFSQLVLAQHYGLPTRLLDITHNPLVALFYASQKCSRKDKPPQCSCNDNRPHNGCLHIFAVPIELIKPFNSDAISVVSNFAKLSRSQQNLLLSRPSPDPQKETVMEMSNHIRTRIQRNAYQKTLTRLSGFIAQEKPYFENRIDPKDFFRVFVVEPQQSFDRLRAQSGAFLISAFHERFEREEIVKMNPISHPPIYDHYSIKIPKGSKKQLIEELRWLNITPEVLFPELDTAAEEIKKRYMQGMKLINTTS